MDNFTFGMTMTVVGMGSTLFSLWFLMHAIGANTGGQIGSVMAAAIMLSVMKGMGIG